MDREKKSNEGEMGSGDSDDEFYNVKLPYTPTVAADKPIEKVEVKKVYSPSRTKVKYDYKFDSSSDDESERGSSQKNYKTRGREWSEINSGERSKTKKVERTRECGNLPQSTYKVVEKINEELKNMKNVNLKMMSEKSDGIVAGQNHVAGSAGNIARSQMGVVSPVVVVPPPPPSLVVPQAPVLNMGSMIVPSAVGIPGQNIVPRHGMNVGGNLLRGPTATVGGLMSNTNTAMSGSLMGMNAVSGSVAGGMMGMQGGIVSLPGNAMGGQGSVVGLQGAMINPAMGGMNVGVRGNVMRMTSAGNGSAVNVMGMTRPMNVSGTMLGLQSSGSGVIANPAGLMVNSGNVMAGNTGGLMMMGGVASASQASVISTPGNVMVNSNLVRVVGSSQGNPSVRPVPPPPPPFFNIRNRPPGPGNFKWQANPRMPAGLTNPASVSSPASSPGDRGNGHCDVDEFSRDDKEKSFSDKSSAPETDESQSPPRELPNTFKNDGSFMEMFKRMNDSQKNQKESGSEKAERQSGDATTAIKKPSVMISGIVGKRRGGRVLKTGLVKKVKKESEAEEEKRPKDAWSMYMAEVKKYREASCEEEGKTRPLVK